jgi:cytochrome d ubiquinol oxidase subunit I
MVMCGMAMIGVAGIAGWLRLRKKALAEQRWFLWLLVFAGPLGFVAIEAGCVVTEVGRQPWVVQDVLRTADAVTPMPHLAVPFATFTALYVILGVTVVVLLRRHVFAAPEDEG